MDKFKMFEYFLMFCIIVLLAVIFYKLNIHAELLSKDPCGLCENNTLKSCYYLLRP